MERRRFATLDRDVAVVGQGTWGLDSGDRSTAIATLRSGLDHGMTHIDTAEQYGAGAVEDLVGEAILGHRDDVFLVSKVLSDHASRKGTVPACEESLARLRTDRLDLYLVEGPRLQHPLEHTLEAFKTLEREGKILAWGVTGFDVPELESAWRIAGGHPFVCNQVVYNLTQRAIEHAVLPWCDAHGVAVVGCAPFGHGRFPRPGSPGGRLLKGIAARHDATAHQIALRFLLRWPTLFTIPKSGNQDHTFYNSIGGDPDLRLSDAEITRIEEAFPLGAHPAGLPVL